MYNTAYSSSYLGPGFIFEPIDKVENSEGTFYQVTKPSGWIASDLAWNDDVYAEEVPCE